MLGTSWSQAPKWSGPQNRLTLRTIHVLANVATKSVKWWLDKPYSSTTNRFSISSTSGSNEAINISFSANS